MLCISLTHFAGEEPESGRPAGLVSQVRTLHKNEGLLLYEKEGTSAFKELMVSLTKAIFNMCLVHLQITTILLLLFQLNL